MYNKLLNKLKSIRDLEIKINEEMRNHTSFKIGGPVDFLIIPKTVEGIKDVINISRDFNIPYMIMGNGSNLLVKDGGVRGIIIKLNDNFKNYRVDGNRIIAESGMLMSEISKIALEHNLTGLEFAEGIPGTVGGGLTMNAGAYNSEMKNVVKSAKVLNENLDLEILDLEALDLRYRNSAIQARNLVILEIEYELNYGNKDEIRERMEDLSERRRSKQPLEYPSGGSTFKRPEGYFAGKLIDDSGLRGFRFKGAQVSEKHCGFVINTNNATFEEVITLINIIQKIVYDKYGVMLEREIKIIGEEI